MPGLRRRFAPRNDASIAYVLLFVSLGINIAQAEPVLPAQQVTATRLPTTPAASTQSVTLLSRADLAALHGLSLSDILRRQAGIVIDRSSASGGYGSLYLRGADPSHTVVLIDGVRQNDPLSSRGSAVDLNTLSIDDIERIEIVRGNASVVNAEAIAGLIHIHTRRGSEGGGFGAVVGADGLLGAHAAWSQAEWRVSASHREDGEGDEGFHRARALNAGWDHVVDEGFSAHASARLSDSDNRGFPDDSGGARLAVLRDLESRRGRSRQLSLRAEWVTTAGGSVQLQAVTSARSSDDDSPGVAPGLRDPFGLPALASRSDYRRDELHADWWIPAGDNWQFTLGLDHQREDGELDSRIDFGAFQLPANFQRVRETTAAFAEARWQREDWSLQSGLRYEHPSDGDDSLHPMLSLQHRLGEGGGQVGASIARSEKRPSFYALGHPLVGNPELAPERSLQRELYYANADDSAWPTRLTLFSARYQDLIDFDAGPPPQLVNRARINADGIEWRSSGLLWRDWRLQLDGSWMRVRDPQGAVELRYRPRLQASAELLLPFSESRQLSLALRHLGARLDSSIPTGDRRLPSATTLDLSLRQSFREVQLVLGLDNAFDTQVDETIGTRVDGRRLRLAIEWSLR
ncbi:MAG: TonB-dependent receptor [Xanthomonadales bacterium]|nr:TonB-dependent receptor [Xanthomonadales bacterium]